MTSIKTERTIVDIADVKLKLFLAVLDGVPVETVAQLLNQADQLVRPVKMWLLHPDAERAHVGLDLNTTAQEVTDALPAALRGVRIDSDDVLHALPAFLDTVLENAELREEHDAS